jgi:hypothetical protein
VGVELAGDIELARHVAGVEDVVDLLARLQTFLNLMIWNRVASNSAPESKASTRVRWSYLDDIIST